MSERNDAELRRGGGEVGLASGLETYKETVVLTESAGAETITDADEIGT